MSRRSLRAATARGESGPSGPALLPLVADITAAYCAGQRIAAAQVPALIETVFAALTALGEAPPPAVQRPAVTIRGSVRPDYLICLEDGRKLKMLRRHLRCAYNMTPEQYRTKWRLRSDYPMVAPNYSMTRSRLAQTWGLGHARGRRSVAVAVDTDAAA